MRKVFPLLFALLLALFPLGVFAHGGNTDGIGGHYNNTTGKYHFHHGYTSHQHPGGRCPYDDSGRTDWSTAKPDRKTQTARPNSYSSSSRYSPVVTVRPTAIPKQESNGVALDPFHTVCTVGIISASVGLGVACIRYRK